MAVSTAEAEWDRLMELAQELEPRLAAAFLEAVDRLRNAYTLSVIEDAIANGSLQQLVDNLAANAQAFAPLKVAVQVSAIQAAIYTVDRLPPVIRARVVQPTPAFDASIKRPAANVGVVFDGYNPRAVAYIQEHGGRLIQQVSQSVKDTVSQVVQRGIREGTGPARMASEIRDFIGLTAQQQQSLVNYRRMLENQDSAALERALRDQRFDPSLIRSLKPGAPRLTADQIDAQVEAMREKTLTYRSETVARSESITALNTGQNAAWRQVVEDGGVQEGDIRRFWHVARGERTCDTCKPIPRMNPDGVGLDEDFSTPDGPTDGPIMHPNCRCTVFVKPFFR